MVQLRYRGAKAGGLESLWHGYATASNVFHVERQGMCTEPNNRSTKKNVVPTEQIQPRLAVLSLQNVVLTMLSKPAGETDSNVNIGGDPTRIANTWCVFLPRQNAQCCRM